ncbi:MAG: cytochrome c3 family protein, partial [Planctomycetota bacterium]
PDNPSWDSHRTVWNNNCIFCHNTGPRPGLVGSPLEAVFDSKTADLGISCESCHGPGEAHAEKHRTPFFRYSALLSDERPDDIVHPDELGQAESIALCAQCHAQRQPKSLDHLKAWMWTGPTYRPGEALDEHVDLVTLTSRSPNPADPDLFRARFWGDGTPRLTAYEAQGVQASPCMEDERFSCASCHSMHGGDPRGMIEPEMRTNAACTSCHEDIGADVAAHTGHAADGPGSSCYDCHMPRAVYGVIEIHRSHRIESPDPKRDAEAGRPNACTLCHLDRSPVWAAREMGRMFGRRFDPPVRRPSGASVELPDGVATLLAGDAVERAVAAAAMGRAPESGALERDERAFLFALLAVTLGDSYPSVRRLAQRALLALDDDQPIGVRERLAAWDPMDAAGARARTDELLELLRTGGAASFGAPGDGQLLSPDFHLDLAELTRLLESQSSRAIAIGE